MKNVRMRYNIVTGLIAIVWLVNGLICKVFGFVPRHEQIVAEILGRDYSGMLTTAIGLGEILIAIWVLSRLWTEICAIFQISLVLIMNVLEFFLVPDLLMWGKLNMVFALLFAMMIYYNEFVLATYHQGNTEA